MILKYTQIKKSELKEFMSKDSYFDAKQSQKYGIVDHVLSDMDKLYKQLTI